MSNADGSGSIVSPSCRPAAATAATLIVLAAASSATVGQAVLCEQRRPLLLDGRGFPEFFPLPPLSPGSSDPREILAARHLRRRRWPSSRGGGPELSPAQEDCSIQL